MANETLLTREGYEKLKAELRQLKEVKRVEVAKQLEIARAHGDLRENAEYDSAKEAKAQLESRIRSLEERLACARVVDSTADAPVDKIYFGTNAQLKNLKTGDLLTFTFVAQDEADISKNKISIESPIGKALLGRSAGEKVDIKIPAGILSYQILKIWR